MTYGLCENSDMAAEEDLLPLGLAAGCSLRRDVPRGDVLTFSDVDLPEGRLVDELWRRQRQVFVAE